MATQVLDLKCPNCGGPLKTGQKTCDFCKQPIIISTFNSVYQMPIPMLNKVASINRQFLAESPDDQEFNNSIAMCYLKLKINDKALDAFEKAMEDNFVNSETFFYAAVCLLNGKKAFLAQRAAIDKIEQYLDAATMIEPKGIYYYFWAYIKFDYYNRKSFKTSPSYLEYLAMADAAGVSHFDIEQLFSILRVDNPL